MNHPTVLRKVGSALLSSPNMISSLSTPTQVKWFALFYNQGRHLQVRVSVQQDIWSTTVGKTPLSRLRPFQTFWLDLSNSLKLFLRKRPKGCRRLLKMSLMMKTKRNYSFYTSTIKHSGRIPVHCARQYDI